MQSNANMQIGQPKVKMNAQTFGAKFQTKAAIHGFFTVQLNAYLAASQHLTIYFLRDLATGKKKYIKNDRIKHITCPMFDGLTFENFLKLARKYPAVFQYLPDEQDIPRLPRQFLIDVIYTIVGEPIQQWVSQVIEARNQQLQEKQNMLIDLDPDVAAAFQLSTSVSLSKGRGYQLLKESAKRRRTNVEMFMEENQEDDKNQRFREQEAEMARMHEKLRAAQAEANSNKAAAEILTNMIAQGDAELDDNGNVHLVRNDLAASVLGPNVIGNRASF